MFTGSIIATVRGSGQGVRMGLSRLDLRSIWQGLKTVLGTLVSPVGIPVRVRSGKPHRGSRRSPNQEGGRW